jgi:hypothetical protein
MLNNIHPDQEHFAVARGWQEHFQRELEPYGGGQMPAPVYGESANQSLRKMCVQVKRQFLQTNHPMYQVQYKALPADALPPFVNKLIEACKAEAYNPVTVPPGQFRQITKRDSNGQQITEFVGQESFVKQMTIPGRRARIRNPTDNPGWFQREVP